MSKKNQDRLACFIYVITLFVTFMFFGAVLMEG